MEINMEDEELVKMFNSTVKRREIILFFLIVMINELIWIDLDIGLNMCVRGRWSLRETSQRKSASVTKFSQPKAWTSLKM